VCADLRPKDIVCREREFEDEGMNGESNRFDMVGKVGLGRYAQDLDDSIP